MISLHKCRQVRARLWAMAALILLLPALVSCVEGTTTLADGGGIGGTGVTGVNYGRITGFGSIFVNGTRFNTDDAVIVVNGVEQPQTALTEGMLVRVEGEWDDAGQGTADRVEYSDDIRGPVQGAVNFDPITGIGAMTVLGQTVRFNPQTVFSGTTRDTVSAGDYLSISGWYQQDGEFLASLVRGFGQFPPGGGQAEIKGTISSLDVNGRRFFVGGVEVIYSAATRIEMHSDRNELVSEDEGAFVEVEGQFQGGILTANEIEERDNRLRAGINDRVKFEGPISFVGAGDRTFIVNGISVRITNATEFDDGLREADLRPGLQVEVEGVWNEAGGVTAREVEPRSTNAKVEARLEAINPSVRVLTVGGVTVQVTSRTLIMDDDDVVGVDDHLSFDDLAVGNYLEVDGIRRVDSNGGVYMEAVRIERDDADDKYELKGRVDVVDVAANQFRVLGLVVHTDNDTDWDDDDFPNRIGSLAEGDCIEMEYRRRNDGSYYAEEVERDDDCGLP